MLKDRKEEKAKNGSKEVCKERGTKLYIEREEENQRTEGRKKIK
jgi:hypothetical protein